MPQDDLANVSADRSGSRAGPFPIGDTGWLAGDFQNGSGVLGLVPPLARFARTPAPDASTAPPISVGLDGSGPASPFAMGNTGWMAGDFQHGSGLLGLVPPTAYGATGQLSGSTSSDGRSAHDTGFPGQSDDDLPDGSPASVASNQSSDDADADGARSDDDSVGGTSQSGSEAKGFQSAYQNGDDAQGDAHLDYSLATPGDARLIPLASNRTLRRQWSEKTGQEWPKTADGKNYHVHHKQAVADGGSKTLDNIEPMDPDEHLAHHMANGDFARWAKEKWAGLRGSSSRAGSASSSRRGAGAMPGRPSLLRPDHEVLGQGELRPPKLFRVQPGASNLLPFDPGEFEEEGD